MSKNVIKYIIMCAASLRHKYFRVTTIKSVSTKRTNPDITVSLINYIMLIIVALVESYDPRVCTLYKKPHPGDDYTNIYSSITTLADIILSFGKH